MVVKRDASLESADDQTDTDWLTDSLDSPEAELDSDISELAPELDLTDHTADPVAPDHAEADFEDSTDTSLQDDWERAVIGDDDDSSLGEQTMVRPPQTNATPNALPNALPKAQPKPPSTPPPSAAPAGAPSVSRRKRRAMDKAIRRAEHRRRPFWRGRVIPKTVLGISFTMLVAGLAMATSGTLLFMQYRYRQDESDALVRNFPAQVRAAQRAVRNEGENARKRIDQQLQPLQKLAATSETLTNVVTAAGPSVWSVRTRDVDGQAVGGSAFIVASDDEKTFLLTSLAVVSASTTRPGPEIKVRKAEQELVATLWTWDESNDLALLVINTGGLPPISWASPETARLGDQVFAVSGFGGQGAAILEGRVADVSKDGLQHSTPVSGLFRGGPLLNVDGRVVAVASRNYSPLGIPTEGFAAPVQNACNQVLRCSGKGVEGAQAQR
jgi:S1-C subfamily serine protease